MADEEPDEEPASTPRTRAPRRKASARAVERESTTPPAAPTEPAAAELTSREFAELERLRARLVTKFTGRR